MIIKPGEKIATMYGTSQRLKTKFSGWTVCKTTDLFDRGPDGDLRKLRRPQTWYELIANPDDEGSCLVAAFQSRKEAEDWAKSRPYEP